MLGTSLTWPFPDHVFLTTGTAALIRQYVKENMYPVHAVLPGEGFAGGVEEEPSAALIKAFMVHSGQPLKYKSKSKYLL